MSLLIRNARILTLGSGTRPRRGKELADLGIIPTGGQMDMWRTMTAGGPKAKLNPVAGDPDKAVTVQQKPDVPPFPSVMYQRGDLLVVLNLTGSAPRGDAKAEAAFIEQMNGKLLKVRQVP